VRYTYVGGPASWAIFADMLEDEGFAVMPPMEFRDGGSGLEAVRVPIEVVGDAVLMASTLGRVRSRSQGQFDIEGLPDDGQDVA